MIPADALFRGPRSLRERFEIRSFWLTVASLAVTVPLIGYIVGHELAGKEIAVLLIGGMLYVTIARGRLIGSSIRIHAGQFGETYEIVAECARKLALPVPEVYVRDDYVVPLVAVGIGEPYAIIISSQWLDHLSPRELAFLVGRELGHIRAGHTRLTSLLSVNGRENLIISIAFGAWLRRIEYTADRVGLLCCGSLESAVRAIVLSSFHALGRRLDLGQFLEQQRTIESEPMLRIGEWLSSAPYATHRIVELERFAASQLFAYWQPNVTAGLVDEPETRDLADRRRYAGFGRRLGAMFIDGGLVGALLPPELAHFLSHTQTIAVKNLAHVHIVFGDPLLPLALFAYAVLLVAATGQTFGMFLLGLRVCTPEGARPGLWRALARYVLMIASAALVYPLFRIFARVQPYEKWSRTRLLAHAQTARVAIKSA